MMANFGRDLIAATQEAAAHAQGVGTAVRQGTAPTGSMSVHAASAVNAIAPR